MRPTDTFSPNPVFEVSLKSLDAIYARRMRMELAQAKENIPSPAPPVRTDTTQDKRPGPVDSTSGGPRENIPSSAPHNQDTQQKLPPLATPRGAEYGPGENIPSKMLRSSLRSASSERQSCAPGISWDMDIETVSIIPRREPYCYWLTGP